MEILETTVVDEQAEDRAWGEPAPPELEQQEMDVLAFELWQRANRNDVAAEDDCSDEEEVVARHESCL